MQTSKSCHLCGLWTQFQYLNILSTGRLIKRKLPLSLPSSVERGESCRTILECYLALKYSSDITRYLLASSWKFCTIFRVHYIRNICTYVRKYVCVYVCMQAGMYVLRMQYMYKYMHVYVCNLCAGACAFMCVYMCVCAGGTHKRMHLNIYIYIYIYLFLGGWLNSSCLTYFL
jgi:hypothetical protein